MVRVDTRTAPFLRSSAGLAPSPAGSSNMPDIRQILDMLERDQALELQEPLAEGLWPAVADDEIILEVDQDRLFPRRPPTDRGERDFDLYGDDWGLTDNNAADIVQGPEHLGPILPFPLLSGMCGPGTSRSTSFDSARGADRRTVVPSNSGLISNTHVQMRNRVAMNLIVHRAWLEEAGQRASGAHRVLPERHSLGLA